MVKERFKVVAEGLILSYKMYELARDALAFHAPEEVSALTWHRFVARESWMLIPNPDNPNVPWYKAEMKVKERPPYDQTIKLNFWRAPDLRRDGAPCRTLTHGTSMPIL